MALLEDLQQATAAIYHWWQDPPWYTPLLLLLFYAAVLVAQLIWDTVRVLAEYAYTRYRALPPTAAPADSPHSRED